MTDEGGVERGLDGGEEARRASFHPSIVASIFLQTALFEYIYTYFPRGWVSQDEVMSYWKLLAKVWRGIGRINGSKTLGRESLIKIFGEKSESAEIIPPLIFPIGFVCCPFNREIKIAPIIWKFIENLLKPGGSRRLIKVKRSGEIEREGITRGGRRVGWKQTRRAGKKSRETIGNFFPPFFFFWKLVAFINNLRVEWKAQANW